MLFRSGVAPPNLVTYSLALAHENQGHPEKIPLHPTKPNILWQKNSYDLQTWEKVLKTNLTSGFLLSKYTIPLMQLSSIPRIIFTSSSVAKKGKAYWGAYSVSKAGIKVLAEILNDELNFCS